MYSTACHRQKTMTKPQQAAQNQQKEAKKISQTLKLPYMGVNRREKIN